jgi:hypothetical protein
MIEFNSVELRRHKGHKAFFEQENAEIAGEDYSSTSPSSLIEPVPKCFSWCLRVLWFLICSCSAFIRANS